MKTNQANQTEAAKTTGHGQSDFAKCNVPYLYRNQSSGVYYVRAQRNGKRFNETLKSDNGTLIVDLGMAKKALAKFLEAADARLATGVEAGATFAEVAASWLAHRQQTETNMRPGTVRFYKFAISGLAPFFDGKRVRDCNAEDMAQWAKKRGAKISARTFNGELNTAKVVFEFAKDKGLILANPAAPYKAKKLGDRKPATPSRAEFLELVASIRRSATSTKPGGKGYEAELANNQSKAESAADLVELMAYTGTRRGEAVALRWQDIDFDANEGRGGLTIHGQGEIDAEELESEDEPARLLGTKNGKTRYVPMTNAARALLLRLKTEAEAAGIFSPAQFVSTHTRCRTALENAAVRVEAARLIAGGMDYKPARKQALETAHVWTHHDFRHFFVTTCIEQGVDIPTVAKWVGHQDGGALLMRTYAHIRDAHSATMAGKVNF